MAVHDWDGIAKDARLPLKYSDSVNAMTACPVCSEQCLRQLQKEPGHPLEFPTGKGLANCLYWLPPSWCVCSKYVLVSVDVTSGLA